MLRFVAVLHGGHDRLAHLAASSSCSRTSNSHSVIVSPPCSFSSSSDYDMSLIIEEEDESSLLSVSSSFFGQYRVPHRRLVCMTSQKIIEHITGLSSAVNREEEVGSASPALLVQLDPQLEHLLSKLQCGDRLRADLPALCRYHTASLIVKCWVYLAWMHAIDTDDAEVDRQVRDQIVWSLMRPFEASHTTYAALSHRGNRHVKTKIKQGLKLTALLLCHSSLLIKFVTLSNVSSDALVTLTKKQLNIESLQLLLDKAEGMSGRVTKHNVSSLLLHPEPPSSSAEANPNQSNLSAAAITSPGSVAQNLLTLSRALRSSLASSASATAAAEPTALVSANTGSAVPSDPCAGTFNIASADAVDMEEDESEDSQQGDESQDDGEAKDPNDSDEECEDERGDPADDTSIIQSASRGFTKVRQTSIKKKQKKHSREQKRRRSLRTISDIGSASRTPNKKTRKEASLLPSTAAQDKVAEPQRETQSPTAIDRLTSATFRAPDDKLGCVDDDVEHDLFCRHHLAWRAQALVELGQLSASDKHKLVDTIRLEYADITTTTSSSVSDVQELYLRLARRWGQRIQFVAPTQMDNDVTMEQALAHVSMEPDSHDTGWPFFSHSYLLEHWQARSRPPAAADSGYDFLDPESALLSTDACKYWVFASDHAREAPGGNSAHMQSVYQMFSDEESPRAPMSTTTSFDSHSGIDIPLPLDLFLRLGCMLVVVVQSEGAVVYVPSAEANESAHLVTTASDGAAISVAGNVLNPRHVSRLVRQHEEEGPSESIRLGWVVGETKHSAEVTEAYNIQSGTASLTIQVPTAETIAETHEFLCSVKEDDARYQPDYYRQSWIPDLFSTAQACRILSEALEHDSLSLSDVVHQLITDMGSLPETRRLAVALMMKAAVPTSSQNPSQTWHRCGPRLGCPGAAESSQRHAQPIHSIRRPPVLLLTRPESAPLQERLARRVHQSILNQAVVCNSFVPPLPSHRSMVPARHSPFQYQQWTKQPGKGEGGDTLTASWMQESLQQRGTVYLTDIVVKEHDRLWREETEAMVTSLVGQQTARGFLLRHCTHPTPGVHTPSYFAMFSSNAAKATAITSPHHNESHRTAAWHLLLRHSKSLSLLSASSDSGGVMDTVVNEVASTSLSSSAESTVRPASISLIHRALAAKSSIFAGSDHLLDDIPSASTEEGSSFLNIPRRSNRSSDARDLYSGSVSLAFGELTEDSSWKVLQALQMSASSRLLDVGSAYGRFCIHAALASPPTVMVTGVEVGIKRAKLAAQFLEELTTEQPDIMARVRPRIRLVQGDILCRLQDLFAHSHILLFDARFVESTWRILAHLLSYVSGATDQVVISCQAMDKCNPDLVRGVAVPLVLSGGKQPFTAHVYTVNERMKSRHLVEVFESPIHGLGVRATRKIRAGQVVLHVQGELIFDTTFTQQSDVFKQGMYPYLTRVPSLDKQDKKAFLHALDVGRYINSHVGTGHSQNATFQVMGSELYVVATQDIRRGQELLHHYENWRTNDCRPWATDKDLMY